MADQAGVPSFEGVPLDLSPGTILDVGDARDQGFTTHMRRGSYVVGEWIACPGLGQEHQIVAVAPIDIVRKSSGTGLGLLGCMARSGLLPREIDAGAARASLVVRRW